MLKIDAKMQTYRICSDNNQIKKNMLQKQCFKEGERSTALPEH
ncbi:hypothetical protein CEV31_1589 [Brucella thiophenivorans]|uniref:Uncharacterized protein n=1 Tax=Brucella thiophenivorans TaxID=571255 RepID=A0A256FZ95_9HYPH|nr:hypothetical protein CEV31_1589 [Brucella thiophenivorans]